MKIVTVSAMPIAVVSVETGRCRRCVRCTKWGSHSLPPSHAPQRVDDAQPRRAPGRNQTADRPTSADIAIPVITVDQYTLMAE